MEKRKQISDDFLEILGFLWILACMIFGVLTYLLVFITIWPFILCTALAIYLRDSFLYFFRWIYDLRHPGPKVKLGYRQQDTYKLEILMNVLPKKYYTNLQQELSDMRIEYFEAVSRDDMWTARSLVVQYHVGVFCSVFKVAFATVKDLFIRAKS